MSAEHSAPVTGRAAAERFSGRVQDYAAHRPRYPRAVLELLRREIGLRPDWVIADVGSGTGLSTELFLWNGHVVFAVEPNDAMRQAAEARLGGDTRFRSIAGTAEATGLADHSIDLVVAAQAFHWFDPASTRRELVRILRPPRWTALIWNTRRTDATPFLKDYEQLLLTYGTDYGAVRHDSTRVADRYAAFFGGPFEKRAVYNEQVLDLDGLRGRLLSSSYVPAEDDAARAPMLRALEALFAKHQQDGTVRIEYDTEVLFGRLSS